MKRISILLVCVMVVFLMMGGLVFGSKGERGKQEGAYPTEIKIGLSTAMTGGWAGFGAKPAGGFKVAIQQINELGGIKNLGGAKLVGVIGDDEATPEKALTAVERLINVDKVVAMIGVWPTQTPTAAQSERNQTPDIDALGIAFTWNRGYRYVFKNYSRGIDEATQEFEAMKEQCELNGVPFPKTTYMVYISDDCSTSSAAGFRTLAEEYGLEILGDEVVGKGLTTYGPVLDRIAAAKPEMLFACLYTPGASVMYREIMERKMYFPYGIMSWGGGIEDIQFYTTTPPAAWAYAWSQENGDQLPWRRPWYNYINEPFKKETGNDWTDSHPAIVYCSVWQLKDALERTEYSPDLATFRDNLRKAIAETDINRENGERIPIPGTNDTFVPAIDPFGWKFLKYDENGVTIDKPGNMSMNQGGVRWTIYPDWSRKLDPEGPKMVKLPLPGWNERMNWPPLCTTEQELDKRIKEAKDHPEWGVWGTAGE
jgi:branched-chain amino acid transport system substrate-binding protein